MKFYATDVKISSTSPPEEILASLAGGCRSWQIAVLTVGIVSEFISSLDNIAVKTSVPNRLNFTCVDGNGSSQCVNANGSICEKFAFFRVQSNVTTFTEKFSLVCEKETYTAWIKNCYRLGLAIGYLLSGSCAVRFGLKITITVFISLQCLTGMLVISVSHVEILIFFMLTHGIFAASIMFLPMIAVCDVVGNNWRTLALGAVFIPGTLGIVIFPLSQHLFLNAEGILATASVLPLIILIPLLYYKASPNYIVHMEDISKAEETLRQIAQFNGRPISSNIKLRPVQILIDHSVPHKTSFFHIWKSTRTRNSYLALVIIWFCMGYCDSTLLNYTNSDFPYFSLLGVGVTLGSITSICLLHCVPHKMVIGIFEFLKCIFAGGVVVYVAYRKENESRSFVILVMIASFFQGISLTAILNVTPRMFPTELRALCFGLCGSVFHTGAILERIVQFYFSRYVLYVTGVILLMGPVLELLASFRIWEVHQRELPDFLVDCLKFNTFYKPTRYYTILDNAIQHEIEVVQVDLNTPPKRHHKHAKKSRK